jgi:chromatin remodeling complex protein RSC6
MQGGDKSLLAALSKLVLPMKTASQHPWLAVPLRPLMATESNAASSSLRPGHIGASTTHVMERMNMATAKKAAPAKKAPAATKKAAPAKKAAAAKPAAPAKAPAASAKKAAPAKTAAAPAKTAAAKKRTPNAAFMKAMTPSPALAAIIGDKAVPRTEVTKKVWEYIKKNDLQDKAKKTMINADAKLKEIFKQAQVSMFEMTKLINGHLK